MKKLMSLLAAVTCLGTLAACATTAAVAKPEEDELAALKRQNAELRQQMAGIRQVPIDPSAMMPPPAQRRVYPPQNWGWMNQRPEGCDSGIYSLEIRNATDYYVDLMLDGERIKIRGAHGLLPTIPPQETIWVCLGSLGTHTFRGKFFACRGGPGTRACQLNEIGYLHIISKRSTQTMYLGRQYLEIGYSNVQED